jgi:hypothetical protein
MGYKDGKAIGSPGTFGACKIDGDDYCVKSPKDYVLSDLSCKPDDKDLNSCGASDKLDCSHELTAMAECDGDDGDNSGSSQKDDAAGSTKKPLLGQLPMANPYFINCETLPDEFLFAGDPGSIYVVYCENGCKGAPSVIHGTGIFDESSSICKSAIHAGIIDTRGGFVTVKISFPHKNFAESVSYGIGSVALEWSKKSFLVSKTISWQKKLSLESYEPPMVGLVAPYGKSPENLLSKIKNPTSFMQLSPKVVHKNTGALAKKFRDFLKKKAFL